MPSQNTPKTSVFRVLAGAIVGCAAAWLAFSLLVQAGIYGMVVPGALIGLAVGYQVPARSVWTGVFAAVVAAGLSIVLEWFHFPFAADRSFSFFVAHLTDLSLRTHLTMAAGIFAAYWFGTGRNT